MKGLSIAMIWSARGLCALGLGVTLALGAVREAAADTAGTGTFTIDVQGFPNVAISGDLAFTGGTMFVGGTPVDLATDVGSMTYTGSATVDAASLSATFALDAADTSFGFSALDGYASCDNASCVGGSATFVSRITSPNVGGLLPAGFKYTFDGSVFINFLGQGPGGVFGINASSDLATGIGSGVTVSTGPTSFFDSLAGVTRDLRVDVTFANVTGSGTTNVLPVSALPGALPAGISNANTLSRTIDVQSDAGFTGPVEVCFGYDDNDGDGVVDGTGFLTSQLRVLHAPEATDAFEDVTTRVEAGSACGEATSLSPFALAIGPALTTTSTVPTGATTSTTTTTLFPFCADAVDCIATAVAQELCPGEDSNSRVLKLRKLFAKKLPKGDALIRKAAEAAKEKKALRLVKKSRKQIDKLRKKIEKFAAKKKNPISPECRDSLLELVQLILTAIDETRLGVTLPSGGGGSGGGGGGSENCSGNRTMYAKIDGKAFRAFAYHESFGQQLLVQGCKTAGNSEVCEQVLYLNLYAPDDGSGQINFRTSCGVGFPSITYTDFSGGPFQSFDWETIECTINVEGNRGGKLTGTFSGTLRRFGNQGEIVTVPLTNGCFSTRPLG